MKNLIINVFKTLFFFDLAVVILYYLPTVVKENSGLSLLINEAISLGVILIFTLFFLLIFEKRKLKLISSKFKFKSLLIGIVCGLILPIITVAVSVILKSLDFTGFNRVNHWYYWLGALLLNTIAMELFFRGYLFALYRKYYGFLFATIVTTLLYLSANTEIFATSKIFAANIILFNVLLCFVLEYTQSIVVNIITRFVYQVLSIFMLGSPLLNSQIPTILKSEFTGKSLYTGGGNGIEKGLIILISSSILLVLLLNHKYSLIKNLKLIPGYLRRSVKVVKYKCKTVFCRK